MINTSTQYKTQISKSGRTQHVRATITLANGIVLNLTDSDFMEKGVAYEDGTSAQDSFNVGSAIIGELDLILNNHDNKFSIYDFYGAEIRPSIGLELPDGTTEWLNKGVFTVDEPASAGATITIAALDNMAKFDKAYDSTLDYPKTLFQILNDACIQCGVSLSTSSLVFTNSTYSVTSRPQDKATTYREIVSYVAQLAGCFARINNIGELYLGWYDSNAFVTESNLDGGNFTDPTSGDNADGGDFINRKSGDSYDGGLFVKSNTIPATLAHITSLNVGTDDITITGVQIVPENKDEATYISGTSGYIVSIEKNPLAQNNINQLVSNLGTKLVGFCFRPLKASALDNPSFEAGDVALVIDDKGNTYQTILSNISYILGSQTNYSADAESQSNNNSVRYNESAKIIQATNEQTEQKISAYDLEVRRLNSLMANGLGFFQTDVKQEDGSVIDYMHDKPNLADSKTVWKKSVDGFAVSQDGGNTYTSGFTSDGKATVNLLSAIGINVDWLNAGTIDANKIHVINLIGESMTAGIIKSKNGKVYIDLDNSVGAFNRLISTTSGAEDVYAEIGTVGWAGGGISKGLGLYSERGTIAYFDQAEDDALGIQGLEIMAPGKFRVRSGGNVNSDDNTFSMYNDVNKKGHIEIWRARGNNSDTCALDIRPDALNIVQDFGTDGTNVGSLEISESKLTLHRTISAGHNAWIDETDNKISFGAGLYERAWADNNGFHVASGKTNNLHVPAGDGYVGFTLHFIDGIYTGFNND